MTATAAPPIATYAYDSGGMRIRERGTGSRIELTTHPGMTSERFPADTRAVFVSVAEPELVRPSSRP